MVSILMATLVLNELKKLCQALFRRTSKDLEMHYVSLISFLKSELINFYSPWKHQKTLGFLMISGGIEDN